MDVDKINSRSYGQSKPNSEVKVDEDTIDDQRSACGDFSITH